MVNAALVLLVLILTWLSFRAKRILHDKILVSKPDLNPFILVLFEKIFTITVFFISGLIVMQILGVDVVPLVTFGGIGAAAVGFACRDVIANFFAGFMIYITRPFAILDLVEIPQKKVFGHIEDIGWYLTTIRDMHKKCIYIPNAVFSNELVTNYSRMTYRRIEEKIRIRSANGANAIEYIEKIRKYLTSHPKVDQKMSINVYLISLGPYGLEFELKAYTKLTDYDLFMGLKQEILWEVYKLAYLREEEKPT